LRHVLANKLIREFIKEENGLTVNENPIEQGFGRQDAFEEARSCIWE